MWIIKIKENGLEVFIDYFTTLLLDDIELPRRKKLMRDLGYEEDLADSHLFKAENSTVRLVWDSSGDKWIETKSTFRVNSRDYSDIVDYLRKH